MDAKRVSSNDISNTNDELEQHNLFREIEYENQKPYHCFMLSLTVISCRERKQFGLPRTFLKI